MKSPEALQPPLKSVSSEFDLIDVHRSGGHRDCDAAAAAGLDSDRHPEPPASEVGLVQAVGVIPGIVLILLGAKRMVRTPRSVDQGLCLRAGSAAVSGGMLNFSQIAPGTFCSGVWA